jgi:hypothetical protein
MGFDDLILNTGYFFLITSTLVFIINYNKKHKALKYFIMYLMLCLFIQIYSNFLSSMRANNLFLSHFFFIGQFIFLSLFFSTLHNFKKIKNLIRLLTIVIATPFIVYLYNFPEALKEWNVLEIGSTSIPLLTYSFFFFVKKMEDNKDLKYIYFNSGFFVYTLCSTLIFTLGNIGSKELKLYVWQFNAFLYLIFQIMIFVEWYKNFRKPIGN